MVPSGAWAELAAVGTEWLAELPDEVSFEQAAALPVAGLTALRALEVGGFLLGKPVLVTGASGGVGGSRFSSPSSPAPMSPRSRGAPRA